MSIPTEVDLTKTFFDQISESLEYLASPKALASLDVDPYWPKWNSPWWHMMLIHEMGLADKIPEQTIEALLKCLHRYLDHFPYRLEDVPTDKDPLADVMCHCQLGCLYKLLNATGVNADKELPFARNWFVQYQLPDGGFNCDEEAYTRVKPSSSVVSTVPILEALLIAPDKTEIEIAALDRGAEYLQKRRLFRSLSKGGAIINEDWAKLAFPRFYEYDLLRGLALLVNWSLLRQKPLKLSSIEEVMFLIKGKIHNGTLSVERQIHKAKRTRIKQSDGTWSTNQESTLFPLLEVTSSLTPSSFLTRQWNQVASKLDQLNRLELLSKES